MRSTEYFEMHKDIHCRVGLAVLACCSALTTLTAVPVWSAPSANPPAVTKTADPSSGTSIFSPPEGSDNQVPSFQEGKDTNSRIRKMLLGDSKDGIPNFQQVRTIPSLAPSQRKELQRIYGDAKDQVAPLIEQLKSLKENSQGGQGKAAADPQARETFQQLRSQIRDIRQQTWQKVKAVLSEQQLQELQAMRHGELTPATFNEPVVGMNGRRPLQGGPSGQFGHPGSGQPGNQNSGGYEAQRPGQRWRQRQAEFNADGSRASTTFRDNPGQGSTMQMQETPGNE